ncbi:MAG TPA: hypothetical protein VF974_07325 [Patescibacteria group bacterium]
MEKINQQATESFAKLLQKLGNKMVMQLEAVGSLPIAIEKLEEDIQTVFGLGTQYSLVHFFTVEGDYQADPEMCFIVIDNRVRYEDFDNLQIYPYYFKNDIWRRVQESITIQDYKVIAINENLQTEHKIYAETWLKNIAQKGFLL